jgi:hypothetical protein
MKCQTGSAGAKVGQLESVGYLLAYSVETSDLSLGVVPMRRRQTARGAK